MSNGASARVSPTTLTIGQQDIPITVQDDNTSIQEIVEKRINMQDLEENDGAFFTIDIGQLIDKYDQWNNFFPKVTPFYAVKCNSDPVIVKVLAEAGTGFDCASMQEIEKVLKLGVSSERIIFANPCKMISHIKYAKKYGVKKMTVDCENELHKIQKYFNDAELVIRIKPETDTHMDKYKLGLKYGCSDTEAIQLLKLAKELQLNVTGVSFHVGSSANPTIFVDSIIKSLTIFKEASTIGYNLSILDIGGGFPGYNGSEGTLRELSETINEELHDFLSIYPDTRVISEPGRYFVNSTHTLAITIHSKKKQSDGKQCYFLTDGGMGIFSVYSTFGCPQPNYFKQKDEKTKESPSVLWGPTAAPDKIITASLPELEVGDWLYFNNTGAYCRDYGSNAFNGFPRPDCYYYVSRKYIKRIQNMISES